MIYLRCQEGSGLQGDIFVENGQGDEIFSKVPGVSVEDCHSLAGYTLVDLLVLCKTFEEYKIILCS